MLDGRWTFSAYDALVVVPLKHVAGQQNRTHVEENNALLPQPREELVEIFRQLLRRPAVHFTHFDDIREKRSWLPEDEVTVGRHEARALSHDLVVQWNHVEHHEWIRDTLAAKLLFEEAPDFDWAPIYVQYYITRDASYQRDQAMRSNQRQRPTCPQAVRWRCFRVAPDAALESSSPAGE